MKHVLSVLLTLAVGAASAPAMERLDALSQIESRNNDRAIGTQREVSRFQILPAYWVQAKAWKIATDDQSPTDPASAREVVSWIMQGRCRTFAARYHHAPTDFEYYILWHRPACYIGRPVPRRITSIEADRAHRFVALCDLPDQPVVVASNTGLGH